jgi:D-xylose transport system substrate-binding protein
MMGGSSLKKVLKTVSLILSLLMMISAFAACGTAKEGPASEVTQASGAAATAESTSAAAEGKQIVLGFVVSTQQEERWVKEAKYFQDEAERLGAKAIVQFADNDENKQNDQVENLVSQKVDALVIASINGQTIGNAVTDAKKAGIPVLSYSRLITGVEYDAYIGFDIPGIGRDLAKAAVAAVPKGNYMLLNGAPVDTVSHTIAEGAKSVLQPLIDKGDIKLVSEQFIEKWAPENALAAVENVLTTNDNKLDAIISSNDGMAGGAVQALKAQNLAGKCFVTGTDGDTAALQRIAEGTQSMTLLFPSKDMAELAAQAAFEMAKSKKAPGSATGTINNELTDIPSIYVSTVVVTKENLNETVIKTGIKKVEDVYKNIPKDQWPK